jgi:hypothetical protein
LKEIKMPFSQENYELLKERIASRKEKYPKYHALGEEVVPESMQMVNDAFIKEYVSLSIRYFQWLRSVRPRHRDACLKVLVGRLKSLFRWEGGE